VRDHWTDLVGVAVVIAVVVWAAMRFFGADDTGTVSSAAAPLSASERVDALSAAVATDPTNVARVQELTLYYLSEGATTGDPSFYERADETISSAESVIEDDPALQILRGQLFLSLHRFADAEELALEALETSPGNVGALETIVDSQVELGRYPEAEESLQSLLNAQTALSSLARLSYFRELNGDLNGATQAMQQAIEAGSGTPTEEATVTTLLGDLRLRTGDYERAEDAYNQALELRSDFSPALTGQARLAAARGDIDNAISQLQTVTDRVPSLGALLLKSELEAFEGDAEAAMDTGELLNAVLALQRDSGQIIDLELADYAVSGDASVLDTENGSPLEISEATYSARPTIYGASVLAWASYLTNDLTTAEEKARESLLLGSLDPVVNYRAGRILADVGDRTAAAEAIGRALEHDPSGTFRHRSDIVELAEELDLPIPQTWAQATVS